MSRLYRRSPIEPLGQYFGLVEKELLCRGYTRFSTNNRLGWLAQLNHWLFVRRISTHGLSEVHLAKFIRFRRQIAPTFSRGSLECVVDVLVKLGALKPPVPFAKAPPSRIERTLKAFKVYLIQERSLSDSAVNQYMTIIKRFLVHRFGTQIPRLKKIVADDLTKFVLRDSRHYSIGTTKMTVSGLRCYFRFLHVSGVIQQDLTGAIPAIAGWRLQGIPNGIEPKQLSRLLRAPNRRTRPGRRDYAILLLLARLGLRKNEVASLKLEDIDWERGEILIRGKGEKYERLPLPHDVGVALSVHLRRAIRRNPHSRAIFLGVKTPFLPLRPGGISAVVAKAATTAGLPRMGAHRLRHTLAIQNLRCGGCLDEIAQVLRHSSHDTTAIYAKVELTALRAVAHVWPGRLS